MRSNKKGCVLVGHRLDRQCKESWILAVLITRLILYIDSPFLLLLGIKTRGFVHAWQVHYLRNT